MIEITDVRNKKEVATEHSSDVHPWLHNHSKQTLFDQSVVHCVKGFGQVDKQCCTVLFIIYKCNKIIKKNKKQKTTFRAAVVLQCLFLNPDWKSDETLFTLKNKKSSNCSLTRALSTLARAHNLEMGL